MPRLRIDPELLMEEYDRGSRERPAKGVVRHQDRRAAEKVRTVARKEERRRKQALRADA